MGKDTPYSKAATKAQEHLLAGFDRAWERAGKVPLSAKSASDSLSKRTASKDISGSEGYDKLVKDAAKIRLDQMQRRPVDVGAHESSVSTEPDTGSVSAYESYNPGT